MLPLAVWIVGAELQQVGIVEASTIGTFHHGRFFLSCYLARIHNDIRLPHAVRNAAMLVALHDVLHWDIPASYASCSGHPHDGTGAGLAFGMIGDMVALFEVAVWSQGPIQVLKLIF